MLPAELFGYDFERLIALEHVPAAKGCEHGENGEGNAK